MLQRGQARGLLVEAGGFGAGGCGGPAVFDAAFGDEGEEDLWEEESGG